MEDPSPTKAKPHGRGEEWRHSLAHDLRAPLSNAFGALRSFEDFGPGHVLSEDDVEIARIGVRACRKIEGLIDAFLSAPGKEGGSAPP